MLALAAATQPLDVIGGDPPAARASACDAGVARRAQQLRLLRRARQRTHERVLTPARADDENLHVT